MAGGTVLRRHCSPIMCIGRKTIHSGELCTFWGVDTYDILDLAESDDCSGRTDGTAGLELNF